MKIKQSNVKEFAERVKGKKNIICFGAGKALGRFFEEYDEYHLEENIKLIVDNSEEKQKSGTYICKKRYKVISVDLMLKNLSPCDVVLVTTARYDEVIAQLELCDKLENIDCYIYSCLRMEQVAYDRQQVLVPQNCWSKTEICIPRTIHYCWFGKEKIPEQNQRWMESWKKYCPDYRIIEWNEQNYDVSKNLYMKQAYEKGKWAFVSDYARVDIIAQYGGVYLDTDVELLKNIDPLLRNEAFCGFESKHYVSFGLGFGAVKGHRIIEELREDYEKRRFVLDNGELNEIACPIYQTELLEKHGLKRNGKFQILKEITIYPEMILCPMSPYTLQIPQNLEKSYSIHHFIGSWLDKRVNIGQYSFTNKLL